MVGAIAFCRSVIDLLSMFQWYRKLRGGHWELWWIDAPVSSHVWLQKDHHDVRPGLGRIYNCEDYSSRYSSKNPYR